jgi:hypothetical protein
MPFDLFPCRAENPLIQESKLRFGVGTFESWPQVHAALGDARDRGFVLDSRSYLALDRVFADQVVVARAQKTLVIEALAFPAEAALIACTSGPFAECLAGRLRSGARSLNDALGHWLIPRHASHFAQAVQAGKIVLWLPISDADDERHAYATLLAHSSDLVGVHDLVMPGNT